MYSWTHAVLCIGKGRKEKEGRKRRKEKEEGKGGRKRRKEKEEGKKESLELQRSSIDNWNSFLFFCSSSLISLLSSSSSLLLFLYIYSLSSIIVISLCSFSEVPPLLFCSLLSPFPSLSDFKYISEREPQEILQY